jgi:putative colanic acid biosynthesis acetyltransferase WcaF
VDAVKTARSAQEQAAPAPPASLAGQPPPAIFQRLDRTAPFPYRRREYLGRFAWSFVQRVFIRPSPRRAWKWRRFWLRRFGADVHPLSGISPTTQVVHPWLLSMGEYTLLSDGVVVYNLGPIRIGRQTVISQDAYLCAGTHDYTKPELPLLRPPITIGSGVWIAAGAFIGPGITIGDNSVIGARAVVTRDVPPGVVAAGNPAKVLKSRPTGAPQVEQPAPAGDASPHRTTV